MLFELNEILVPQYTNTIQIFQLQKSLRLRKRIQCLECLHPMHKKIHCTMREDSTKGVRPQENKIHGQNQKNSVNSMVIFISFSVLSHINDFIKN